ncbi:hypothetical protein [Mycolicibacterium vaccae]
MGTSDRTAEVIDREIALLVALRRLYGGSMTLTDQLLDERLACLATSPE